VILVIDIATKESLSLSLSHFLSLSEAKRKFYETRAKPRAIGWFADYAEKCDYYLQLDRFGSQRTWHIIPK